MWPARKNIIHEDFNKLIEFAGQHEMLINGEKTKAMFLISARTREIMPQVLNGFGECSEIVEELKML